MEICQERRKANPNIVYNSLVTFWNSMTESESFFKTTKWSFLNQAALLTTARELQAFEMFFNFYADRKDF